MILTLDTLQHIIENNSSYKIKSDRIRNLLHRFFTSGTLVTFVMTLNFTITDLILELTFENRGHPKTTLTIFPPFLTTYLLSVDIIT